MATPTWYFRDSPNEINAFLGMLLLQIKIKERIYNFLERGPLKFALGRESTPFAEHCITTSPNPQPTSVPSYRLYTLGKEQLRNKSKLPDCMPQ